MGAVLQQRKILQVKMTEKEEDGKDEKKVLKYCFNKFPVYFKRTDFLFQLKNGTCIGYFAV